MRIGLYPGTFDPVTVGHVDIISRAVELVDRLVIGVARKDAKGPLFSTDERVVTPFGRGLRHWRRIRGVSQLDLAATAATTTRHVSSLETGRSRPSREMVERLGRTCTPRPRRDSS